MKVGREPVPEVFFGSNGQRCVLWYCQWSQFIVRGYNSIRFETQKRAQIRPLISNIDVCTRQYKCWHILSIQIIRDTNIKMIAIYCQQLNSIRSQTQQNWKCTLIKITFDWCVSYQCWHCFVITIIVSCPTIRSLSLVVQQCNSNTILMNSLLQFIASPSKKCPVIKRLIVLCQHMKASLIIQCSSINK